MQAEKKRVMEPLSAGRRVRGGGNRWVLLRSSSSKMSTRGCPKFPQGHAMVEYTMVIGGKMNCDLCRADLDADENLKYGCTPCDFDVCARCVVQLPRETKRASPRQLYEPANKPRTNAKEPKKKRAAAPPPVAQDEEPDSAWDELRTWLEESNITPQRATGCLLYTSPSPRDS